MKTLLLAFVLLANLVLFAVLVSVFVSEFATLSSIGDLHIFAKKMDPLAAFPPHLGSFML